MRKFQEFFAGFALLLLLTAVRSECGDHNNSNFITFFSWSQPIGSNSQGPLLSWVNEAGELYILAAAVVEVAAACCWWCLVLLRVVVFCNAAWYISMAYLPL